jgi:hypothetical protein
VYSFDLGGVLSYTFPAYSDVFCSIPEMKRYDYFRRLLGSTVLALLLILTVKQAWAISPSDTSTAVNNAAMKLVQFCVDPKGGLDDHAVATLVDYVLSSKQERQTPLPKSMDATGAYYEFDTRITFPRFVEYTYNPLIPATFTRPSSVRYSFWVAPRGSGQHLPENWKPVPLAGPPLIIHSMQRESDTPDLNTGVYHEYDLKRTLIMVNHKGSQALISISKQVSKSDVGKKGVILGDDNDWNYYYSGEPGSPKTGLGWVKTYIYDYFSVGVYVESGTAQSMVRTGVFQWLRAGWTGINFVKPNHILNGMERFARNSKLILESPRLPAPTHIISAYQSLSTMPPADLLAKYTALQQTQRASAIRAGKIAKGREEEVSFTDTPKEQMVEELILEYLKTSLGRPTLLGKQSPLPPNM